MPEASEKTGAVRALLKLKDLRYNVVINAKTQQRRQILAGVSAVVPSKKMLCLLGPSGSGKTSLIQVIAGKIRSSDTKDITGLVTCNGQVLTPSQFQRIAGFVSQEDLFNAELTVEETVKFMAKLKLPAHTVRERMAEVVRRLQLESCLKSLVGDDKSPNSKGISGGEKRRLSIAMEILDPTISVLVLDEPTCGLDAASALNVVKLMRNLCDEGAGMVVMSTLHQPRDSIMALFNDLMILDKGRRAYYGALEDYVPYLKNELQCEIPPNESAYAAILDVLNPAIEKTRCYFKAIPETCDNLSEFFAETYQHSALRAQVDAKEHEVSSGLSYKELAIRESRVSWLAKCSTILRRTFLIKLRDPLVFSSSLYASVMMALLIGMIYWGCYDKDVHMIITDTQMAITLSISLIVMRPCDVVLTFPKERQIFLRERKAGLYSTSVFYVARVLSDMPIHMLTGGVMALIIYPMCGFHMGFHCFLFAVEVAILVGASIYQMIATLSRNYEEGDVLSLMFALTSMVLASGFIREVPVWLEWARAISVMGINGDVAQHLEFRDLDPKFGPVEEIYVVYGIRVRSDSGIAQALGINFCIYICARVIGYLACKFLHTGRTFKENLRD